APAPSIAPAPSPEGTAPVVDEAQAARERRHLFKQTMLLGLPTREPPPPSRESAPPPSASGEPAVQASAVRVVGPPKQPPPRRSRRVGPIPSSTPAEPEPDHEAFALMRAIVTPDGVKKVLPGAAPVPSRASSAGVA